MLELSSVLFFLLSWRGTFWYFFLVCKFFEGSISASSTIATFLVGFECLTLFLIWNEWLQIKQNWFNLKQSRLFPYNITISQLFKNTVSYTFITTNAIGLPPGIICSFFFNHKRFIFSFVLLFAHTFIVSILEGNMSAYICDFSHVELLYTMEENILKDVLFSKDRYAYQHTLLTNMTLSVDNFKTYGVPIPENLFGDIRPELRSLLLETLYQREAIPGVMTPFGAFPLKSGAVILFVILFTGFISGEIFFF